MTKNGDEFYKEFDLVVGGSLTPNNAANMISAFEWIAGKLFQGIRDGGIWYDGLTGEVISKRKKRQLEVVGKMWVADRKSQWLEDFHCLITDKVATKQGLEVKMTIGKYKAHGDVLTLI